MNALFLGLVMGFPAQEIKPIEMPDATLNEALAFNVTKEFTARNFRLATRHMNFIEENYSNIPFAWRQDAEWCAQVWNLLDDCLASWQSVETRDHKLKRLRRMLGDEAYYSRVMPPPTPQWIFTGLPPPPGVHPPSKQ